MAFIRFEVVVKLFKFVLPPFLSPCAHPGLKYVHVNCNSILTKQNQDKEGFFFGVTWWSQQAIIGGCTIYLRKPA